jgi:hypothetical protein
MQNSTYETFCNECLTLLSHFKLYSTAFSVMADDVFTTCGWPTVASGQPHPILPNGIRSSPQVVGYLKSISSSPLFIYTNGRIRKANLRCNGGSCSGFAPSGGTYRTVIEHLPGRVDAALSAKALIFCHLVEYVFSASVYDNCPAGYHVLKT